MSNKKLKDRIISKIDAEQAELVALSRQIRTHPELAFQEYMASSWLSQFLVSKGFDVEKGVGELPTAFVATKRNKGGPTIAFLAEYDALPNVGHGCGHNLIGTGAVGAALGLSEVMNEIEGTIKVIGTPAEEFTEGKAGKILLLERGVFSDTDACLMFHPWTETGVALSDFGFIILDIAFEGKPAHAAADPWNGLNALDAVILTYNNISVLRQQLKSDSRVHCIITHGGDAVNIIPKIASLRNMFRSPEVEYLEELLTKVENCARGAAQASQTHMTIQQLTHVKPSRFNATLYEVARNNLELLGEELPKVLFWGASSDFGNVSQEMPAISLLFKTHEFGINWHSETVASNATSEQAHFAMLQASKVMAMSAIDLFTNPILLDKARLDFDEKFSH